MAHRSRSRRPFGNLPLKVTLEMSRPRCTGACRNTSRCSPVRSSFSWQAATQGSSKLLETYLIINASNRVMGSNSAFRALADPTRRNILDLLRRGEKTAGELAEHFDMTKPSMSYHFSVLKEADLITTRREGQQIWYGLNATVVQDLIAWAIHLIGDDKKKEQR